MEAEYPQAQPDLFVFDDHPGQLTPGPLPHQPASPSSPAQCAGRPPPMQRTRQARACASQSRGCTHVGTDTRQDSSQARACASQSRACTHGGAGARQDIARACGGGGEHTSRGAWPSTVRQQNNTKGWRTPAPRAQMGSPPAADTRPDVLQQTRAVHGAGAALPRCLGPRSADLQRPCRVGSKSGREGRRDTAAQHTHYGAGQREAGQTRAMRASSGPHVACSARSRAPHALSSRFSP